MPQLIEDFRECAGRQRNPDGKPCRYIVSSSASPRTGEDVRLVRFENGAVSNGNQHFDPPRDPHARLKAQRAFVEAALKREELEWKEYRAHCLEMAEMHRRWNNLKPGVTPES